MKKHLNSCRHFAGVVLLFLIAFTARAAEFPDTCQFDKCFERLSPEKQAEIYEAVRNGDPYIDDSEVDPVSGLKHFYFYTYVPFEPRRVIEAFVDFPTHQGVAGITKAEARKTPYDASASRDQFFEVYYELSVSAFTSKYVVDHQLFRDERNGWGSMWRWSPETDRVQGGFFGRAKGALTKPSDIRGYLYAQPYAGGAIVTYYSYQVANVQKVGVGTGTANRVAREDLTKTVTDFRRLWMRSLVDPNYLGKLDQECSRIVSTAPQLKK